MRISFLDPLGSRKGRKEQAYDKSLFGKRNSMCVHMCVCVCVCIYLCLRFLWGLPMMPGQTGIEVSLYPRVLVVFQMWDPFLSEFFL